MADMGSRTDSDSGAGDSLLGLSGKGSICLLFNNIIRK
jgi:hypothetical protein